MAKATKEQLAWREVIEQWETDEQLQVYLTEFYRSDVNDGEPLTAFIPELKLVLLSINAIVSTMYMEAFNYDNITARNYAYVAEALSHSMSNLGDRDLYFLERKDVLKPFPKELREVRTVDYQGGHYNIKLSRAKAIINYLKSKEFREHMEPLILADAKRMFRPSDKPKK